MPPWIRGWSVFTRPSSISGKPVTAATSVTGRPAVAQRPGGPAGRHELEPEDDETPGEVDQAALVADRQERPARHGHRGLGPVGIDDHPARAGLDAERPGQGQGDGPRQEPVLDRPDPGVEARLVVVGQDRDGLLGHDRAAVERGVDEVDGRPADRDAVGERIAHGMRAGERRRSDGWVLRIRPGNAPSTAGPTIRM